MKKYYARLIAIVALGMFVSVAHAKDPKAPKVSNATPTWDTQINGPERFVVLAEFDDKAVLDTETGLVWEQLAGDTNNDGVVDVTDKKNWNSARFVCTGKNVGRRQGWRLPAFYELTSLVDLDPLAAPGPEAPLPAGHPFSGVVFSNVVEFYWSATSFAGLVDSHAWATTFTTTEGFTPGQFKGLTGYVWCVRGGSPGPSVF